MAYQYFNFKRFCNAFKYDLRIGLKLYLSLLLGLIVALVLINIALLSITQSAFEANEYVQTFYFTFLLSGILIIATSFPLLRGTKSKLHYLMLPASVFEKVLIQFCMRFVIFIPVFFTVFWLDFKLAAAVYNLFEWSRSIKIGDFNFLEPLLHAPSGSIHMFALAGLLLTIAAFLFAGATYFRRYTVIKTVLAFALFLGGGITLFRLFTMIFFNSYYKEIDVFAYLEIYSVSEQLVNIQLYFYVIAFLSGLFLLPLAYFKLKEKQL